MSFPETLNLNSFITDINNIAFVQSTQTGVNENGTSSEHGSIESAMKFDDCSTTDSGSALEEETSTCGPSVSTNEGGGGGGGSCNTNDPDLQEDDEGIDMTSSTDNNKCGSAESGPYMYELFAIMIHSGSASGGHYYAYIKDIESDDWYCFNDQTVSTVSSFSLICLVLHCI